MRLRRALVTSLIRVVLAGQILGLIRVQKAAVAALLGREGLAEQVAQVFL